MSFVFYDTETTGTNRAFDQILQFGAIKTDHELREQERFEIRCRLLPYVVPAPGAIRTTGISVDQLADPGLPTHYEMVRAIKTKLEQWSPAVFVGHNSIDFDERLLRQALYKTLHHPYLTNSDGNCRLDSLRIARAVNLLEPGIFSVRVDEKKRPVFKLDQLAPDNGFRHVDAHDAIGDVQATIHICRLLSERAEARWSNFVRFSKKATVLDFSQEEEVFWLTDNYFGRDYCWMVTALGRNPDYDSQLLVFDLSHDPSELAALNHAELGARLTRRPKPVRTLQANACPCVVPYEDVSDHLRSQEPDVDTLRRRAARIRDDEAFVHRLIDAFMNSRETKEAPEYVEEQISSGLIPYEDQAVMAEFHEVPWSARAALLEHISDPRIQILGKRLLYTEAPEVMQPHDRSYYQAMLAKRLMGAEGPVPWLTLPQAIKDTDDLLTNSAGTEASLLKDLREYLAKRTEEAEAVVA